MPFIPYRLDRNLRVYFAIALLHNACFTVGGWYLFWRHFATTETVGLIDTCGCLLMLLMEIPSGAFSDLFGRKRTLIIAFVLQSLGFIVQGLASGEAFLWIGHLTLVVGLSFMSGTIQSFGFESALEQRQITQDGDRALMHFEALSRVSVMVGSLLGAFMLSFSERLPWFALAGVLACCACLSGLAHEPKHFQRHAWSWRRYREQLVAGSRLVTHPRLQPLLGLICGVCGIGFIYSFGFLRPAIAAQLEFSAQHLAYAISLGTVVSASLMLLMTRVHSPGWEPRGLLNLAVLAGIGFAVFADAPSPWLGFTVLVLMGVLEPVGLLLSTLIVNRELSSEYRATTLSTLSMLNQLPYLALAVVMGKLTDDGQLALVEVSLAGMILMICLGSFRAVRRYQPDS